jgi:16S rRNA (cytosine967-C5)-methyltransferase
LPSTLSAALDVIARQRAAGEPLERVLAAVVRGGGLGSRARHDVGDLVFSWARQREGVEGLVDAGLSGVGGSPPSRRARDLCAVLLAAAGSGIEADEDERALAALPPSLVEIVRHARQTGLHLPAALPGWLEERLGRCHDLQTLLPALARPAPLVVAVDTRRATADDVVSALRACGVAAAPSPLLARAVRVEGRARLSVLPPALRDAVWPMDDGSQAVADAVAAEAGMRVLDLCAGGGGKARFLASTGASVVAVDLHPARLAEAPRPRVLADGRAPPFAPRSFDRVLVDAPCSGTGTLRRAPDLARRLTPETVDELVRRQRALLAAALPLVRPGGVCTYATCSLLEEEGPALVADVVRATPGARLVPPRAPIVPATATGIDCGGWLLPSIHGCDGFFLATIAVG